jgi:hypothetical protein
MGRKRKPSINVREKEDPFVVPRVRLNLTWARKAAAIAREQPVVLIAPNVGRGDDRGQPFPRRHDVERSPEENGTLVEESKKVAGGGEQGAEMKLRKKGRAKIAKGEILIDAKQGPARLSRHSMRASVAVPQI